MECGLILTTGISAKAGGTPQGSGLGGGFREGGEVVERQ